MLNIKKEMADQLLYEMSNDTVQETEPFVQKQMVYIIDQNNGSYNSNQVLIDTSSLSNSGKYASYSEAFLTVPIVINLRTTAGKALFGDFRQAFAAGIKNGYYQFIHSMSVEYNNTNVIQLTPYTNFYVNYKLMTSMSQDDLKKIGPTIGFYPDTSDSFSYQAATSLFPYDGFGSCNNRNFGWENIYPSNRGRIFESFNRDVNTIPVGTRGAVSSAFYTTNLPEIESIGINQSVANYGFWRRQKMMAFNPTVAPYANILLSDTHTTILKNYCTLGASATANATHEWFVLAHIRLKDMADFFDKMPLVKGAYLRFIINVNTSVTTLSYTAIAALSNQPANAGQSVVSTTLSNGTCPIMLASHDIGQGNNSVVVDAIGDITFSCAIAKGYSSLTSHKQTSCRLYVPLYTMNPVAEEQYLSLNRTKKIVYRDIYQYTVPTVATNTTINQLITNGISNPKTIVIIPIFAAASNPVSATVNLSPYQSPFASEPATTSPLAAIGDFNIQLAGVNIFQQNIQYDWELFVNELKGVNALNGGLVNGLTSGLITEYDFSMMYRYYVVDVSRRLAAEDLVPKSIQILGKNLTRLTMDYYIFVEVEKSITIDLQTGTKLT